MVENNNDFRRKVAVCDTQAITIEGLRAVLAQTPDFVLADGATSLERINSLVRLGKPDVLIIDKAFGIQSILEWMREAREALAQLAVVIWGISITEPEALRYLQAGARGILRKGCNIPSLLNCLRTVVGGANWMEDIVPRELHRSERFPHAELTPREIQVMELVEQGLKNKEIARELAIQPGTVKIHLKHIFEKTGVRGRYGLALSGLKNRRTRNFDAA
jgi:two-component system nitrate/nitrite response regulator NarL